MANYKDESIISLPKCLGDEIKCHLNRGEVLHLEMNISLSDVNFVGDAVQIKGLVNEVGIKQKNRP